MIYGTLHIILAACKVPPSEACLCRKLRDDLSLIKRFKLDLSDCDLDCNIKVKGFRFRVQDLGLKVQGLGLGCNIKV